MEDEWMTAQQIIELMISRGTKGIPRDLSAFYSFTKRHGIDIGSRYMRVGMSKRRRVSKLYHVSILTDFAQTRSDDWLSARDIICAKLPGFSQHYSSNIKRAGIRGWFDDPEKVRIGRGTGRGNEFHISLLTEEQRAVWLEYCQRRSDGGQADPKPANSGKPAPTKSAAPKPVETTQPPIPPAPQVHTPDLSAVKNSQLIAELVARVVKAMGDGDSFFKALGDGNG